jgi:hypothetical protein
MKKASAKRLDDDLRPEYDLAKLKGGVRGKYYRRAVAGTNLVLIEPNLAEVFRDAESVNRALRLLVDRQRQPRNRLVVGVARLTSAKRHPYFKTIGRIGGGAATRVRIRSPACCHQPSKI